MFAGISFSLLCTHSYYETIYYRYNYCCKRQPMIFIDQILLRLRNNKCRYIVNSHPKKCANDPLHLEEKIKNGRRLTLMNMTS